jgi:hypothetical protein
MALFFNDFHFGWVIKLDFSKNAFRSPRNVVSILRTIFFQGMQYFFSHGLVDDNPSEIARFFHYTATLSKVQNISLTKLATPFLGQ